MYKVCPFIHLNKSYLCLPASAVGRLMSLAPYIASYHGSLSATKPEIDDW